METHEISIESLAFIYIPSPEGRNFSSNYFLTVKRISQISNRILQFLQILQLHIYISINNCSIYHDNRYSPIIYNTRLSSILLLFLLLSILTRQAIISTLDRLHRKYHFAAHSQSRDTQSSRAPLAEKIESISSHVEATHHSLYHSAHTVHYPRDLVHIYIYKYIYTRGTDFTWRRLTRTSRQNDSSVT